MLSNSLLGYTSISQWALFLGIGFIIFGIIEKRDHFILGGQLIFITLGLLALWVLFTNTVPEPTLNRDTTSKIFQVFVYFKGAVIFMGYNIFSLFMKLFRFRYYKLSVYLTLLFALFLFFMVFNIQQLAS